MYQFCAIKVVLKISSIILVLGLGLINTFCGHKIMSYISTEVGASFTQNLYGPIGQLTYGIQNWLYIYRSEKEL